MKHRKAFYIFALLVILCFIRVKTVNASSAYPAKAIVVSDVSISGGGRTTKYNQLDLYMTSSDARNYAEKVANGTYG